MAVLERRGAKGKWRREEAESGRKTRQETRHGAGTDGEIDGGKLGGE